MKDKSKAYPVNPDVNVKIPNACKKDMHCM